MDDEVYITFSNCSTRWKITNLMLARMQSFGLKNAIFQGNNKIYVYYAVGSMGIAYKFKWWRS